MGEVPGCLVGLVWMRRWPCNTSDRGIERGAIFRDDVDRLDFLARIESFVSEDWSFDERTYGRLEGKGLFALCSASVFIGG